MNWDLQKQADSVKFDNLRQKDRYRIAKRTLDCLISYCDEDGDTTVSIETIYKRLQCCAQTVTNHFEILTDLNILTLQKQGRKMYKKIKFISSSESSNESSNYTSNESSNYTSNESSSVLEAKKEKKEKKESSSSVVVGKPPTTSLFLDNATTLSNYLLESILDFQPTAKKPANLSSWIKDIELLLRIDNREPEVVQDVIDWIYQTQDGDFWKPNIRSGKKLREKFDTLEAQMRIKKKI